MDKKGVILDAKAADEASIPFVYAEYGFGNVMDPQYTISKISELLELVNKIL